nr:MBL fold metallo-hydrolase [Anaerolineaceae bacterium]
FNSINNKGIIIDPAYGSQEIVSWLQENEISLEAILITHAHFDHMAGAKIVSLAASPAVPIGLHPVDIPLWEAKGGAEQFGFQIDLNSRPDFTFEHNEIIQFAGIELKVFHTPGHSPGHVIFYCQNLNAAFCGDVIFKNGIGRSDVLGGNHETLINSIRDSILTLPENTQLYCGHGSDTTVAHESENNPFLK